MKTDIEKTLAKVFMANLPVHATKMTENAFTDMMNAGSSMYRVAQSSRRDDAEGYLVETPQGISNHPKYSGRIEWIPAAEFQYRHREFGTVGEVPTFVQRLLIEHAQLEQRLKDLLAFTKDDNFMGLTTTQRDLLLEQCRVMHRYSFILNTRIEGHLRQIDHKKQAIAAHK